MPLRRTQLRNLLAELFHFFLLHGTLLTLIAFVGLPPSVLWLSTLLVVPCALLSFLRLTRAKRMVFAAVHILLPLTLLLLPFSLPVRLVAVVFVARSALRSVSLRLRRKQPKLDNATLFMGSGYLILLSLALSAAGYTLPARFLAVYVWAGCLSYLYCHQTARLDATLEILSEKVRQPLAAIRAQNNRMLLFFLTPTALLTLVLCFLPFNRVLGPLGRALTYGIFTVIEFLFFRDPEETYTPPPIPEQQEQDESPWFAVVQNPYAEAVITFLIYAFFFAALLLGSYLLLSALIRRIRYLRRWEGDEISFLDREGTGKPTFSELVDSLRPGRGTEQSRIRRRYTKTVKRHIKSGISIAPSDTTAQIQGKIKARQDITELTKQYRKARYSRTDNSEQ